MRISHSRTSSVDSDFGSFVSVPSAEDPLHQVTSVSVQSPFTPLQNFEFFGNFTEEAKAATAKNQQGVLDELLNHEADPLYFLRSGKSPRAAYRVILFTMLRYTHCHAECSCHRRARLDVGDIQTELQHGLYTSFSRAADLDR